MSNYGPNVTPLTQTSVDDFVRVSVIDFNTTELLIQVVIQLKLISQKLDCLQPDDDEIDELDILDIQ